MSDSQSEALVLASILQTQDATHPQAGRVVRADIVAIKGDGTIDVLPVGDQGRPFACDVLESAFRRDVRLEVGDIVLTLVPSGPKDQGCILGRIAAYRPAEKAPDHVVIEAEEKVTIRCGDASLDLRKDGKLMIRGKDVLTRAKRTQRIKGGTVAIN